MIDAEVTMRWALMVGAIAGAVLSLTAFLLSRFMGDIAGRTLLVTGLFTAAGAYFGLAVLASPIWLLIEFLQCIAFGVLGLVGWRGSAKWLVLGWALHPVWDFGVHYIGPANFAPWPYASLSQSRLGCSRLHSYSVSRSHCPNAESCTMIVCERSGPVETNPICTPICSDKKST